jgi:hypothetical protein
MSSYGSIWVKINASNTDLLLLREQYNANAMLTDGLSFACVVKDAADGDTPTNRMQELSQRFGEAIFMSVQTVVDFFIYSHWRNGELVREIQYCADGGWYELDGEKEDWEQQLFSEEERLRQLSYLDLDHLAKNPSSAEYAEAQGLGDQIATVWAGKELQQDSFYPMATASELYQIVMQEYGLTDPYCSK